MVYLRQYVSNGFTTKLGKARLFGIAREKYINNTPNYCGQNATEYDGDVFKHPELNEYCLMMNDTNGLPEIFVNAVETELPEGWFSTDEI